MGGGSARPGGLTTSWAGFGFAPVSGTLSYRELIVAVAQAAGGGTALRADAEVVWVVTRSARERVPAGVTVVTITVRRPLGGRGSAKPISLTVTRQRTVRRIVEFVDALPTAQPGTVACPNDVGPMVELDFRARRGAPPVAVAIADGSGCGFVTFAIRGHTEPKLADGPRLIKQLTSLLGISLG